MIMQLLKQLRRNGNKTTFITCLLNKWNKDAITNIQYATEAEKKRNIETRGNIYNYSMMDFVVNDWPFF